MDINQNDMKNKNNNNKNNKKNSNKQGWTVVVVTTVLTAFLVLGLLQFSEKCVCKMVGRR